MAQPASFEPATGRSAVQPTPADAVEEERHRRVMASERVMRKHRNVLAALAESERRDREAEVGHGNIRTGLAG